MSEQAKYELLDEAIPSSAVRQRDSGTGFKLSYLEGHYVIDRLNKIFGNANWSYELKDLRCVHQGQDSYDRYIVSYLATVRLTVKAQHGRFPDTCIYEDVGFGNGLDKKDPGKCHELATKEAVTDALKRCAKNLGQSMGLALYDKEQTNVEKPAAKTDELKKISELSAIVIAKRKTTKDALVEAMQTKFGTSDKTKLTVKQRKELVELLNSYLN